jgi:exonuclease III
MAPATFSPGQRPLTNIALERGNDFGDGLAAPAQQQQGPARPALVAPWSLRVLTLNVRGLVHPDKRRVLFPYLRKLNADVICLQETHASKPEAAWWSKQWTGPSLWTTSCNPSTDEKDRTAGTALLFNKRFLQTDLADEIADDIDGRFVHATLRVTPTAYVRVVGLYAPNKPTERREFFARQQDLLLDQPDNVPVAANLYNIVLGDFNCVENPRLDRVNTTNIDPTTSDGVVELLGLTSGLNCVDVWRKLNPNARATTWRNTARGSRIDRVYLDRALLHQATARIVRCIFSDHDAVLCTVNVAAVLRGKGYWKLNTAVLARQDFQTRVRALIKDNAQRTDLPIDKRWDLLKTSVRVFALRYCTDLAKQRTKDVDDATAAYAAALQDWSTNPTVAASAKVTATRLQLEHLERAKYAAAAVRSHANWMLHGEQPTHLFCQLEQQRGADNAIHELEHPDTGATCTTPADLGSAASAFYSKLFAPDAPIDDHAIDELLVHMPKLDDAQRDACDRPITLDEIKAALDATPNGKTPGIDGLPKKFYATFWDELGPLLLGLYNDSIATGQLPATCRQGVLSLLFKKRGARTKLGNYRPLTMLTCDYKLLVSISSSARSFIQTRPASCAGGSSSRTSCCSDLPRRSATAISDVQLSFSSTRKRRLTASTGTTVIAF